MTLRRPMPEIRTIEMPAVRPEERITDPVTGGQKGRKPERLELIPFDALEELGRVYDYGMRKGYAQNNWLKGYAWGLSAGALLRHIGRFMLGADRDPESGCLHIAHAAWHCLTLCTFILRKLGTDDRAKLAEFGPDEPVPFRVTKPSAAGTYTVDANGYLAYVADLDEDDVDLLPAVPKAHYVPPPSRL